MSHTPTSKKFEVGDIVEYIPEEDEDEKIRFLLLKEPTPEENPMRVFAAHRWTVMNIGNGEIAVTYVNTDLFRKVV